MPGLGLRVLVTGGAGYIGTHTLVELLLAGHDVHVVDNLSNGHAEALNRCSDLVGREFGFSQVDIRDAEKIEGVVEAFSPDVVIHFAGLKSPAESLASPELYFDVNVTGSRVLLNAMRRTGCRRLVFSSSAAVYGNPEHLPITEEHPRRPTTPYGRSKADVEDLIAKEAADDPTFACAALRYFNPAGAHPSGRIGEQPQDVPPNLVPLVVDAALGKRSTVTVFGDDYDTVDGTGVRDYLHVSDLAHAHLAALDWTGAPMGMRPFNVGTGRGTSVRQILEVFSRCTGEAVPYRVAPRRPGDVATSYADPQRAHRELGWRAGLTLEDMCRSALHWGRTQPKGYG